MTLPTETVIVQRKAWEANVPCLADVTLLLPYLTLDCSKKDSYKVKGGYWISEEGKGYSLTFDTQLQDPPTDKNVQIGFAFLDKQQGIIEYVFNFCDEDKQCSPDTFQMDYGQFKEDLDKETERKDMTATAIDMMTR
jgi:hypothetical protein